MTPEAWRLGEPEDNPKSGVRIVDVQDVTIATVWKHPHDSSSWAEGNIRAIVKLPRLKELVELLLDSQNSTGCTDDLTVVSLSAVEKLEELIRYIDTGEGDDDEG